MKTLTGSLRFGRTRIVRERWGRRRRRAVAGVIYTSLNLYAFVGRCVDSHPSFVFVTYRILDRYAVTVGRFPDDESLEFDRHLESSDRVHRVPDRIFSNGIAGLVLYFPEISEMTYVDIVDGLNVSLVEFVSGLTLDNRETAGPVFGCRAFGYRPIVDTVFCCDCRKSTIGPKADPVVIRLGRQYSGTAHRLRFPGFS